VRLPSRRERGVTFPRLAKFAIDREPHRLGCAVRAGIQFKALELQAAYLLHR
jgi:hypothetical protein